MDMKKFGNWQKYNNTNPIQELLVNNFKKSVSHLVMTVAASNIADIGCAEGFISHHLSSFLPDMKILGIDIDFAALLRGQKLGHTSGQTQQANIYNIPYATNSFDLILALEVLEHLERPDKAILELKRIARQYCILSVPYEPYFRVANLLRGKNIIRLGNDVEHVNHWNKTKFADFLNDNGFHTLTIMTPFPWILTLNEVNYD